MPFNFGSSTTATGTASHIPQNPTWFFPLRLLQGLLAIVTLALSAFVIDTISPVYDIIDWHGTGMNIWTSILTFIYLGYIFLTAAKFARLYNNWAVLGFEVFLVIFWLVTFALLAEHAKEGNDLKRVVGGFRGRDKTTIDSLTAAAVLSAINFVLFCVTCIFFALNLKKHRTAGHPMMAPTASAGGVKMGNVNPTTGTQQQYGANPADGTYKNSPGNYGQFANQPVANQQYPAATYNQPVYNQQGHNAV